MMDSMTEQLQRRRMHGLFLSRTCEDIEQLSSALMGLHCWFHRNVAFSAVIRGADLWGWKDRLTKTWLYRGTLHGVVQDDLPQLLALHADEFSYDWIGFSEPQLQEISLKVIRLMEDGVFSRAEMRGIFAYDFDEHAIERLFSPWGGIFVYLARKGQVAFRNMTSRDFDMIDANITRTQDEVLPELLYRYFTAYGPATLEDAAWFLGLWKESAKKLSQLNLDRYERFEHEGRTYYDVHEKGDMGDIPKLTLLSGFDPLIVSYVERGAVLPAEYKSRVILKSGICLPTIAVNGQIAGLWNIKKGEPVVEFFKSQPKSIKNAAYDRVCDIQMKTHGVM